MATTGTIVVNVAANTRALSSGLQSAASDSRRFAGTVDGKLSPSLGRLATRILGVASAFGILRTSIGQAAKLEQSQVAFTTMIGNAEQAKAVLGDLSDFAASTPFQLNELTGASQKLLAFGVATDELLPSLQRLGDVSAGIGAPIAEIAEIYGKARVQGRLFAEDINQLTGRGIPIIAELAKQFGVAESEVKKLVESGQVNFGNLEKAFVSMTKEGAQFGGLMEAQSKTLTGQWSTFKDQVLALARSLGQTLLPVAKKVVAVFQDIIAALQGGGSAATRAAVKIGVWSAAFTASIFVIGKVVKIVKTLATVLGTVNKARAIQLSLMGPKGWAILATGAGIATASVLALNNAMKETNDTASGMFTDYANNVKAVAEQAKSPIVFAEPKVKEGLFRTQKAIVGGFETGSEIAGQKIEKALSKVTLPNSPRAGTQEFAQAFVQPTFQRRHEQLLKNISESNQDIADRIGESPEDVPIEHRVIQVDL